MIAVLDQHVYPCITQQPGQRTELSRRLLVQPGHDDIPDRHTAKPGLSDGPECERAVVDEVVRYGLAVMGEDTTAFQADTGATEGLTEIGQRTGPVGQADLKVLRVDGHAITTVVVTSTGTDSELAM